MILIPLLSGHENSHQRFSIQLGDNLLDFRLDWIYYYRFWSMSISVEGVNRLSGGVLSAGTVVNRHVIDLGVLTFEGSDATLNNLGKDNKLIWSPE